MSNPNDADSENEPKKASSNFEIVPYLSVSNAEAAVEFYERVFGVPAYVLLHMPDGRLMHGEFRIGAARFFVSDELPEHGGTPSPTTAGKTTVAMHLYVDDCDAQVRSMADANSEVLMEPTDVFWGERFARVRDPFGHEWGIASVTNEMTPEEIKSAAAKLFSELR